MGRILWQMLRCDVILNMLRITKNYFARIYRNIYQYKSIVMRPSCAGRGITQDCMYIWEFEDHHNLQLERSFFVKMRSIREKGE